MTAATALPRRLTTEEGHLLVRFAKRSPLAYNDFASIALTMPPDTAIWVELDPDGAIVAAVIDDGLAMTLGGDEEALARLAQSLPSAGGKLMISGRTPEVEAFVAAIPGGERRRPRPEHFMVVTPSTLRGAPEQLPLRVATAENVPLLVDARSRALEEEYGVPVPEGGALRSELASAVERAVAIQGVAIWIEHGKVAFTAQLVAKTPVAATFGDLYTDPELRGVGRATRGLVAFCHWLMSESEHVALRVGTSNTPAVRLYERVGFSVVEPFVSSVSGSAASPIE